MSKQVANMPICHETVCKYACPFDSLVLHIASLQLHKDRQYPTSPVHSLIMSCASPFLVLSTCSVSCYATCMQLCLVGSQDTFVVSGSDDGWIFIWDRHSGQLVNMLHADDRNVSTVAVHPFMPMLASSGSEPVVKLWSPQVTQIVSGSLQQ